MINENNLMDLLPESVITNVYAEEDFVNIVCRDYIIDGQKNQYLGDLLKSMRIKKGSVLNFPLVEKIEIDNLETNYKEYYLFNEWINEKDGSKNYHTISDQTFICKRKLCKVPMNAYVQLIGNTQTMIQQFIIYSFDKLVVDYLKSNNGYDLRLSTTYQFDDYSNLYAMFIDFKFILNGEFEGNSIEQDIVLKFSKYEDYTYIEELDTTINVSLYISDAPTGD